MNIYKRLRILFPALSLLAVSCSDSMTDAGDISIDNSDSGTERTISLQLSVSDGFEGDQSVSRAFGDMLSVFDIVLFYFLLQVCSRRGCPYNSALWTHNR